MTALPISRLINVSVQLSPALAQQANFNSCMILGTSPVIDVTQRLRTYSSLSDIGADFGQNAEEYLAAVAWFSQAPQPTELTIGRWANAATHGQLIGGPVSVINQVLATWNAINAGATLIYVDAVPYALGGLNFAASVSMPGVANVIQAALVAAGAAGATVTWDAVNDHFLVSSGTLGANSTVSFLAAPTAIGSISFGVNAANNDTITIGGTLITFKAAGPVVGNQVLIGGNTAATLANLLAFLTASVDANITQCSYSVAGNKLYLVNKTPGAGGNAFTIAASVAITSGATLTGGVGTDISVISAMRQAGGAYLAPGIVSETALQAVQIMDNRFSSLWYGLVVPRGSVDDQIAVAAYIDADDVQHFYGVTSTDPNELISGQITSLGYLLKQQASNDVMWQYSSTDAYAVVSALARILTTNWNGSNTAITLMYKQEPGVAPENLNISQVNALETNNGNVFVSYNNQTSILEKGICPSGQFVDTIIGLDWLASFVQTNLYNVLYGTTTKIPQTDGGNNILATSIESSCQQAVDNGLLAPGVWNATGFGQLKQGQTLSKGFYVYAPPIATQNPADRAARKSVPFQIAAKMAGAIHTADVIINVNQ